MCLAFDLPPLRERVEDIAPLAGGMIAHFSQKFHKDVMDLSPERWSCWSGSRGPGISDSLRT